MKTINKLEVKQTICGMVKAKFSCWCAHKCDADDFCELVDRIFNYTESVFGEGEGDVAGKDSEE